MNNKSIYILGLVLVSALIMVGPCSKAQDKDKKKIHIVIKKEVNGEEKTFDKTYQSTEEMMNDPELKAFDPEVQIGKGGSHFKFHSDDDAKVFMFEHEEAMRAHEMEMKKLEEHLAKLPGKMDSKNGVWFFEHEGDSAFQFFHPKGHKMNMFISENMDSVMHLAMRQVMSADSLHRVMVWENGKEMDFAFKMLDSIPFEMIELELDKLDSIMEVEGVHFRHGGHPNMPMNPHARVFIRKNVVIKELDAKDKESKEFKSLINKSKALELDELSFYPNPNDGQFRLRFRTQEGKDLKISIFDMAGREVYGESFNKFSGQYDSDINLSMREKGIYLLQISQDGKTLNKKLVIE